MPPSSKSSAIFASSRQGASASVDGVGVVAVAGCSAPIAEAMAANSTALSIGLVTKPTMPACRTTSCAFSVASAVSAISGTSATPLQAKA